MVDGTCTLRNASNKYMEAHIPNSRAIHICCIIRLPAPRSLLAQIMTTHHTLLIFALYKRDKWQRLCKN